MIDIQEAVMEAVPVQKGAAVEVHELRKEFRRKDSASAARSAASAARALPSTASPSRWRRARRWRSWVRTARKSTLVRLLSFTPPAGRRVCAHPRTRRRGRASGGPWVVNRVSVEASFFKKMSASENLSYAARYYGMTSKETRAKIPEILERVGFPPDRQDEPMEALSRGMQQKVALARALLTSPVVLLLDEPTTGLDPRSKLEVQEFIREIRDSHDSTILLCTHDLGEAEILANRVGILDRGRLLALESADAIKQLRGRDAGGGVLRRDRARVRGGRRRGRRRGVR